MQEVIRLSPPEERIEVRGFQRTRLTLQPSQYPLP
jgi:hypothetical protein